MMKKVKWFTTLLLCLGLFSQYATARDFTSSENQVIEAYLAYYGRLPDLGGLNYWSGRLDSENGDLGAIIDDFGNSAEFNERFGNDSNEALVINLYQQLFSRDPDDGGLTFYADSLAQNTRTLRTIAVDIINGATGSDQIIVENRTEFSRHFVENNEAYAMDYLEGGDALIASIDNEQSTLDTQKSALDELFFNATGQRINRGRFIDSPVAGVTYATETLTGVTDINGEFLYFEGQTCSLSLGDIEFPAVTAAHIITPLELAGVDSLSDTAVENMARLLQSLDTDCNPDNGISISADAILAATGLEIDFNDENFDTAVVELVANAGQKNDTCKTLISAEQAVAHLQDTLDALSELENPPIGGGLSGHSGTWTGLGQQDGVISWTIEIELSAGEQLIAYPSLSCGGTLTLLTESDAQLLFREKITYGTSCFDNGFVELTDQSANELVFRWYFPDLNDEKGDLGAIGSVTRQ